MRIGSLFSGIGGLEKGLEDAGVGHIVWQVERDPFCRQVLAKHWPDAVRHDDVRTVGAHNLEAVDVVCGGFPCQDISYAGKGAGLAGERSGLWYEFARIVGEMGPRYVVVENVAALLTRGIDAVLGTLADLGYNAEWSTLRASDVGAPHRRERVFLIAWMADATEPRRSWGEDARTGASNARTNGCGSVESERSGRDMGHSHRRRCEQRDADERADAVASAGHNGMGHHSRGGRQAGEGLEVRRAVGGCDGVGDAESQGLQGRRQHGRGRAAITGLGQGGRDVPSWHDATPVRGADGTVRLVPAEAAAQGPESPLWPVAHGVPGRVARLRAIGNAVVPQVAAVVGRRLLEIDAALRQEAAA